MSPPPVPARPDRGTFVVGGALVVLAAVAWVSVWRSASGMTMEPTGESLLREGIAFTMAWGVMMAAMMLPSALPMILLYRTVSRGLSGPGERAITPLLFAAIYLVAWALTGIPVFVATAAVAQATAGSPALRSAIPYALAATIAAAGIYQLTPLKQACLRWCEAPLAFLMERWRSGYRATLALALRHAGYCVGCCWGLMVILVAAGAMSLPWVLLISLIVFAEKVLPGGRRVAQLTGVVLLVLAGAVALRPELAVTIRFMPSGAEMLETAPTGPMAPMAPMPPMDGMDAMDGMDGM